MKSHYHDIVMKPYYYDIKIPTVLPTKDIPKYIQNHLDAAYELGLGSHQCRIFMPGKKYTDFLASLPMYHAIDIVQAKTFYGVPLYIIHPDTAKPEVNYGPKTIKYAPAPIEEPVLDTIITMQ